MPENILPYHIAWRSLSLAHQAILWTHYVSDVEQIEKLRLLNVDGDTYRKWLAVAQRKIEQEIRELPEPAPEPPEPKPGSGPLWTGRIIHKLPISNPNVDPFPPSPLFHGFRMSVGEDENDNYVFRLPSAEIYATVAKRDFNQFSRDETTEFLDAALVLFNEGKPPPDKNKYEGRYNTPDWIKACGLEDFDRGCICYSKNLSGWRKHDR